MIFSSLPVGLYSKCGSKENAQKNELLICHLLLNHPVLLEMPSCK